MRVFFLSAEAMPFLRRYSPAFSMSASHSTSAFLQSAIPAPVRSRRSLIICAVTSAIALLSSSFRAMKKMKGGSREGLGLLGLVLGRRGGFGRRQIVAAARHDLDLRALAARRHPDRLRLLGALRVALGTLLVRALAADLLAEQARVRHLAREQLERADRIVVAGDRVVDEVRVAVRVDDRDDRDLE